MRQARLRTIVIKWQTCLIRRLFLTKCYTLGLLIALQRLFCKTCAFSLYCNRAYLC